ncbi:Type I restriction enzyme EcoKI M protein [Pseudovibrio sp. W64]|uniref:class I SAM-dependent DNA methyltransferase n=1 Tax=Pseudovibrio sp. W64 TaxID=1735583 RepID=UPI0007AEB97E|nr:N-6 DNA methylase [Pseudovibrio sp. W64]KZK79372.1 Type I restriction enzyme EcoKI M protein [Pseudovibrio sp. W64]
MNTNSIVQKLWRLCSVLRKDGITYQQYVTELTYLLFLKMMQEKEKEEGAVPTGMRWVDLVKTDGLPQLELYRDLLTTLGTTSSRLGKDDELLRKPHETAVDEEKAAYKKSKKIPKMVQDIFENSATFLRDPVNLNKLVTEIDKLDWYDIERDQFGDLYEGLLQKNAEETKKGAGQYFTPRVLIDVIVDLMQPQPGERIQDPATGTGGFLIAADRFMKARTDGYYDLGEVGAKFQKEQAFHGMENVRDTYRLLLMNLYLHDFDTGHILAGDTLSPDGEAMCKNKVDVILTNPPFGPAGGKPTRDDLSETANVSSYQLPFVEHCIRGLKPGGRAAIVIPDNVLFEDGKGKALRQMMMQQCNVHTILRLPTGIFYAQGVKTNVIFLQKSAAVELATLKTDQTQKLWVYDLRNQMPQFGKTSPLTEDHFAEFVKAYGADANGGAKRVDEGEEGRFRCFTRDEIAARGDNLDIKWLQDDEEEQEEGLSEPEDIAAAILGHLTAAMTEIEALSAELEEGADAVEAEL